LKILQVHNRHWYEGGQEVMYDTINRILMEKDHNIVHFERNNRNVQNLWQKIHAFKDGIYSSAAKKAISSILESEHPEVAHIHNIYTSISPSIFVACQKYNVPVVLRCADFRLISCPISSHLRKGQICERCLGGREYWCVLKNCRSNIFESVAYTMRSSVTRMLQIIKDNVTLYVPPSKFVKQRMIDAKFPEDSIVVVPNMVSVYDLRDEKSSGEYVAYVGRISPEKGIETLLNSTCRTGLPVLIAGDYSKMPEILNTAPPNAQFIGPLNRDQLIGFYQNARFTVIPSILFETFGLVATEAMSHGLPVIASRRGALPEIVEDGVTGFLFNPGNAEQLTNKMKLLWENPDLCRRMGRVGRQKVILEYSEDVYYKRLMAVYKKAIKINNERKQHKAKSR